MNNEIRTTSNKIIKQSDLTNKNHQFNLQNLRKQLAQESLPQPQLLCNIMNQFEHLQKNQPNLIQLNDPVVIIGDIHGQLYDFLKILSSFKRQLDQITAVFMGDYVDRGINSVEVFIILMTLKIQYPKNVFLLRGNHQSQIMTAQYNFKQQCCSKYSQDIYQNMLDLFKLLPLACVVNKKYFCVHGGISDKLSNISEINKINRVRQIPLQNDPFCDLIWSDPTEDESGQMKSKVKYNDVRDCSIIYGAELVNEFLKKNNLLSIIRGHEVFLDGYKFHQWNKSQYDPPSVITVFSAPNYCGISGNKAAILKISQQKLTIKQFKQQQPQKYKFLSKFDAITWTLPEIYNQAEQIVYQLMKIFINQRVPELTGDVNDQSRISSFMGYYTQFKKGKQIKHQIIRESEGHTKRLSQEEERQKIFNRSHQYLAKSQKLPKK